MGNVNCRPCRKVSKWFRSRTKSFRKTRTVTNDSRSTTNLDNHDLYCEQHPPAIIKRADAFHMDENEHANIDTFDCIDKSPNEHVFNNKHEEIENDDREIVRVFSQTEMITKDGVIDKSNAVDEDNTDDNDFSLSQTCECSLTECMLGDDIPVDPMEASLLANGIEDVSLDTRDSIDVMVAFKVFPRVKAIERIKTDARCFKRRNDPISEEERTGSIHDLSWSRHMRGVHKEINEGRDRLGFGSGAETGCQASVSFSEISRFFKNTRIGHPSATDDVIPVSSRDFMPAASDTVAKDTGLGTGSENIPMEIRLWKLPAVD